MIGLSFTMSNLIRSFRDGLRNSVELSNFCTDNYNKTIAIGIGADERREWGGSDAPFALIVPASVETGMSQRDLGFTFDIDLGIKDDVFEDYEGEDIAEMLGVYKIDEMANIVVDLIETMASSYNAKADLMTIQFDSSTFFPLHVATITVQVQMDHVINGTLGL